MDRVYCRFACTVVVCFYVLLKVVRKCLIGTYDHNLYFRGSDLIFKMGKKDTKSIELMRLAIEMF